MTMPETTSGAASSDGTIDTENTGTSDLSQAVTAAVRHYLDELGGQLSADFYPLVLAQVEAPLLREIMAYTNNNQTKASAMLGLNRGTLRKKLKQYGLLD